MNRNLPTARNIKRQRHGAYSPNVCVLGAISVLLSLLPSNSCAAEPVSAKLTTVSAWTGEAVGLIVTLYSPGPFSGSASFDLPDLPLTVVIRGGSPVVGSESIDGESVFTQRHELTIYTQRSGEIVIPAFRVRFAGKQTFTSPAEPMEGLTPSLTFESKRPPGTEKLGVVVAATEMQVSQNWTPDVMSDLNAGDVIQRTVTRRAKGTTAMMMAPISEIAPEGVQVYIADPVVEDRSARGIATANRSDTLKYQFQRPGTFTIPDTTVLWWDPAAHELQQETLKGRTVSVVGDAVGPTELQQPDSESAAPWNILAMAVIASLCGIIAWKLPAWLASRRPNPERRCAQQLLAACQADRPNDAYVAFLSWRRVVIASGMGPRLSELMRGDCKELSCEVDRLTRQLFASSSTTEKWAASALAAAFSRTRRLLSNISSEYDAQVSLPLLNPSSAEVPNANQRRKFMMRGLLLSLGLYSITATSLARANGRLVDQLTLGVEHPITVSTARPPAGWVADADLGLLRPCTMRGQVVHTADEGVRGLFETRAVRTRRGDLLLMFPEGNHYAAASGKVNTMIAYRSSDDGSTWQGPTVAFDIDYSQHGFIPFLPRDGTRLYAFGTQPIPSKYSREAGRHENTPIGYRWSDDDGQTWSDATLIHPSNDPSFLGMSVMRMCETDSGAWVLGSHAADWSQQPLTTRQYLLRSEDRGATWSLLPGARPAGWYAPRFNRMDEGRPINLGRGELYFMARTPSGRLWSARSVDDGQTWSLPEPSALVHPDAPPMLFHLSDGETLIAFHHNRHLQTQYDGLKGDMDGMKDRSEIWIAQSLDGGRNWTEPQFLFANATQPNPEKSGWFNHQASYLDAVIDNGRIHLFCPHLWNRALYLTIREEDLAALPTVGQLANEHKD